jgi:hypothetical protein
MSLNMLVLILDGEDLDGEDGGEPAEKVDVCWFTMACSVPTMSTSCSAPGGTSEYLEYSEGV